SIGWSAPASRATSAFSLEEIVVMILAPFILANWIMYWLTAPAPPETKIVEPFAALERLTACTAVIAGIPRHAPALKSTLSGRGTACSAGRTMNSAAEPKARFH